MSEQKGVPDPDPDPDADADADAELGVRDLGATEHNWCRAICTGTGITVLASLFSKPPNLQLFQNALNTIQISQPIISSKLHFDPSNNSFSFITPPTPSLQIQQFDLQSTSLILQSPNHLHSILEHELNLNTWLDHDHELDLFFGTVYELPDEKWAVVLRLHTAVCDNSGAAAIMREVVRLLGGGGVEVELGEKGRVNLGIEEMIPSGKASKAFWARGVDMFGYSLNSLRLSNLNFEDVVSPRSSQVVWLRMDTHQTARLLDECKRRGIKLCGALVAAAMIVAHSSKQFLDLQWEKYAVVTLIDCRSLLEPVLTPNDLGFYHSAIINTHDVRGDEQVWELATRAYSSFANSKNNNKHFSDMNDLNFLMCKAIQNPRLTPSSTLRTSLISVFEDSVVVESNEQLHQEIGLEDYVSCSSVHGVGPSLAVFNTIRDGQLDCSCVYPTPVHSRKQMEELVESMKRILIGELDLH